MSDIKSANEFAYFRILSPSGFENTIIESRCGDCAGDGVAKLVLGPGPYWDGYMEGIDYEVTDARNRGELPPAVVVVVAPSQSGCSFCEDPPPLQLQSVKPKGDV